MKQTLILSLLILTQQSFAAIDVHMMNLQEKIGQLLMVHFNGNIVNDDVQTLINELNVGAVIYYNWSNDLSTPLQTKYLSAGLQQLAKKNRLDIPLLIAADQEGGIVTRAQGLTIFPGNMALAATKDLQLAQKCAEVVGKELNAVGINMNLAPVADINCNPRNPVIGVRSFGADPAEVTAWVKSALVGYHNANMITTLKHFPGHGDVEKDSHEELPILRKSCHELLNNELIPFMALANESDVIMTAHLLVPAWDDVCCTLSKKSIDFLRNEIGFKGVIITDSLVMEGVLKNCLSIEEAAINAFLAGHDILLLGGKQINDSNLGKELTVADIKMIKIALINAVINGRISQERLNASVERIIKLKEKLANDYYTSAETKAAQYYAINNNHARTLAKEIASHSVKFLRSTVFPKDGKILVIAPESVKEACDDFRLLPSHSTLFYTSLAPNDDEINKIVSVAACHDVVIVCSNNAWRHPQQQQLINRAAKDNPNVILVALRDALDAELFPDIDTVIATFSPTTPSIQAACGLISSKLNFQESTGLEQ